MRLNPLNKYVAGLIILANCFLCSNTWAQTEAIFIYKEQVFQQTDNNPTVTPSFWYFNAGVSGGDLVTGATLTYPGSGDPVALTGDSGNYETDSENYLTQAAMDTAYPNGQFSMAVEDNGSTLNFGPLEVIGDTYPAAPYFLNLEEIATHDGAQDFLLKWSPFTESNSDDQIIFQIRDIELDQEVLFLLLPNTANGVVIPGGSMTENFSYRMELFFLKSTDKLDTPQSLVGYISSAYTTVSVGSSSDIVNIPDDAVHEAVRLELNFLPEENITYADLGELSSLSVTSDSPIDLSGLQYATGLTQFTLYAERILDFYPITTLDSLQEVKLVAPQKEGMFFTHWSDGNQENPRIVETTGSQDFGVQAQYASVPLSPFAGGYSLIVNGTVNTPVNLPNPLDVEAGDPYELRLNYLILQEAVEGNQTSVVELDYHNNGLLPRIAMEAQLRIGKYRWFLSSTNAGVDQASITATSSQGFSTFQFTLTDNDAEKEYDFPYSYGNERMIYTNISDQSQDALFNGPLKIPDGPGYVNWEAITSGAFSIGTTNPNDNSSWAILLSQLPGPDQSYRIEKLPAFIDSTQSITGYSADKPTTEPGTSTEHIDLSWTDPHSGSFETSYEVWRGVSNHLAGATLVTGDLSDTSFIDPGVVPGRNYYYWIRAIRDGLKADYSASVSSFRAIAVPEDIQATQGDFSDRIRISWTRVSGASSYSVYRSTTDSLNDAELLAEGISSTEYEDFSPTTDDLYYYWVTSEAFGTSSDFSNSAAGYRIANGITTVRASDGLYNDRVQVTWDAFPEATSYNIFRNTINESGSASVLASNITATQYDDLPGPESQGITFFYWVRPNIGTQTGSLSNTDAGYIPVQRNTTTLAWGDNDFDQTNLPDTSLLDIVEIAAGANHSIALTSDGTVVAWGRNEFGQSTPPTDELNDVVDIAVGYDHSLALNRDGTVVAWGRDTFGKATVPNALENVIDIQAGAEHSLALLANGNIVGWGSNDFGQTDIPEALTGVVQIAAGGFHNLARKADGSVVTWGDNRFGQQDIPAYITQVIDIAAGWNHCLVILANGTIDGWGDNSRGQLEFPADTQDPPQAKGLVVRDPVTARIVDISGGLFHSLALSAKGELSAWGEDKNSQTKSPQNLGTVSQIDAGDEFNLVVAESPMPKIESLIPTMSNLLSGEDILLKVRATGGPDISYQWLFNNTPLEGATDDALLLNKISLTEKGSYSVKVTSGGNEVSSSPILIEVTENQASISSQTVRAIRTYNGTYLFTPVETDPPGLKLKISSADRPTLPTTSGTHMISIDIDQQGYAATPIENVRLELDALADESLRLIESESATTIRYFAPEGFSSILQTSSTLRDWITLAKVANGDGQLYDFHLRFPTESFYRVVFELPESN